jgi:hypothetical protein
VSPARGVHGLTPEQRAAKMIDHLYAGSAPGFEITDDEILAAMVAVGAARPVEKKDE